MKNDNNDQLLVVIKKLNDKIVDLEKSKSEYNRPTESMLESGQNFKVLVESARDAIIVIQNDVIKFANQHASKMYDKPLSEIVGQSFLKFVHTDNIDIIKKRYADWRNGKKVPNYFEVDLINATEEKRICEINSSTIVFEGQPSELVFIHDITERKQAEEVLRESEDKYRNLFENSPLGIININNKGDILDVNENMVIMLGSPSVEETKKINVLTFPPLVGVGFTKHYKQCLENGNLIDINFEYTSKWGKTINVRGLMSSLHDANENIVGVQVICEDITKSKKIEEQNRKFSKVIETTLQSVIITNIRSGVLYANPSYYTLSGFVKDDVIGKSMFRFADKKGAVKLAKEVIPALLKKGHWRGDITIIKKNKQIVPVDLTCSLLSDEKNKPEYFVAIFSDVTERKQAEEKLVERNKELNCFYGLVESIRTKETIEEILQDTAKIIPPAWQYPKITRGKIRFNGKEYVSQSFKESKWKLSADIILSGKVVGSIEVYYLEGRPELDEGPFMKEERKLINGMAKTIGEAIRRKQAEDVLRDSQVKYYELFEKSNDGIFLHDLEGSIIDTNKKVLDLFGYTKLEMLSLSISDLHPPEEAEKSKRVFETIIKKGFVNFEIDFRKKSNEIFHADVSSNLFEIKGKQVIQGIVRDITKLKQEEAILKKSEELNKAITNTATDAIISINSDGNILTWNKSAEKIFGFSSNEMINRKLVKIIPQNYKTGHSAGLKRLKSGGKEKLIGKTVEITAIRKNGTEFPIDLSLSSWEIDNNKFYTAIIRDITERKQVEEKLISRNKELETWYDVTVDRELKMIELKIEVNELYEKSGKKPKYEIPT